MEIRRFDSYETLSREASSLVLDKIRHKNNSVLCAATGNSPTGIYSLLKRSFDQEPELFSKLRIIKLDEWGGVPPENSGTCESYLQSHLIELLKIETDRNISFNSNPDNTIK